MKSEIEKDAQLIDSLGGAARVASLLGFPSEPGVQRVHNWKSRGIPARIKLAHPDLFITNQKNKEAA